jgi:pimeloyl-ACP methyl ester carboxylesterase
MNAPLWKPLPAEITTINVGQYEVPCRVLGAGPPILCAELPLNGFARFHLLQEKLATKYKVFVIDLRPVIGYSVKAPPADDLLDFISDFSLKVMDDLGVKEFSLCGSFMYGAASMNTSLKAPDRVRNLILLGPTGLVKFPQTSQLRFVTTVVRFPFVPFFSRFRLFRHLVEGFDYLFLAPGRIKQIFYDPQTAPVRLEDLYEQNKTPEYTPGILTLMWAIRKINYDSLVPRIPDIKCPTLIVQGAEDEWIPMKYAEQLQSLISGSVLKAIPKSKHAPEIERVDLTFDHIDKFLAEHSG